MMIEYPCLLYTVSPNAEARSRTKTNSGEKCDHFFLNRRDLKKKNKKVKDDPKLLEDNEEISKSKWSG